MHIEHGLKMALQIFKLPKSKFLVVTPRFNPLYFHINYEFSNYPNQISSSVSDLAFWNRKIASHVRNESNFDALELFIQIQRNGFLPNPFTFSSILCACARSASLDVGEQAHCSMIKLGHESNVFCGSALLDMYSKCSKLSEARQVFDKMPERNVVTWNSLIAGYSQSELCIQAFKIFCEMLEAEVTPSPFTLSAVLVTCSRIVELELGIQIHGFGFKLGFCSDVVVGTALIDMYAKCSSLEDARKLFNQMPKRNVVTWTSMITGYALYKKPEMAMVLVREMRRSSFRLNKVTYSSLLTSCSDPEDLDHGKQVHSQVVREGLESNAYLTITLITMYSRCGNAEDFYKICRNVFNHDQIAFNSIISGLSHLGNGTEVLEQFRIMNRASIDLDFFTFSSVLRGIGILAAIEEGQQIHALAWKTGYSSNVNVQNALVSMYAKCGKIDNSKRVFSMLNKPDLVSWNSLIAGCAQHGYGNEAVELFELMRKRGVKPDHATFLSVLSACSHVGLLDKGFKYFDLMREELPPRVEHYSCIVDLLGRSGYLDEAESFINNMPIKPGISVYRALLSACRLHQNLDMAIRAAKCLLDMCPTDSGTYVLLSNAFAAGGCWDDSARVRKLMSDTGLRKKAGFSCIEVNKLQQFFAEDLGNQSAVGY